MDDVILIAGYVAAFVLGALGFGPAVYRRRFRRYLADNPPHTDLDHDLIRRRLEEFGR